MTLARFWALTGPEIRSQATKLPPGKGKGRGKGGGGGWTGRGGGGGWGKGGRGGAPATPQPDFANVHYLPDHENAAHNSTAITDLATGGLGNPHSLGFYGDAKNDTGDSAFGSGSSILLNATGHINKSHHNDFAPISAETKDTAEFCWEWHIKRTSNSGAIFSRYYASQEARCWKFGLSGDGNGRIYINGYQDGSTLWIGAGTSMGTSVGQWHHFACARQNGVSEVSGEEDIIRMFIDGVPGVSFVVGTMEGFTPSLFNAGPYFGAPRDGDASILGRLDNIRIVMGEPVYTEEFTPPTARHPTS